MTHENRNRIIFDDLETTANDTFKVMPGFKCAGKRVTVGDRTGMLVLNTRTGYYWLERDGALSALDQRKVKAALGISNNAGAPTKMEDGRRRNVYIDDTSWERAQALGAGNASEGIRIALELAANAS
ncbi:hypothetical protein [Chitinolyticbacter meiyuanensis]|uniref:hypothetical protein n=1 Tax=Chitinolyticbacter meiyuanensis TaxID=682798 RepID=UPI0011E58CC3|nr:hypothetical protein [Chitinolyticbacter meiyuanensis]